jgi:hypothetical protein
MGLGIFLVLLSLGPFVYIGGVNTRVPTPWTLLRYAPVLELARSPARFSIPVVLMLSVLFACALAAVRDGVSRRRLVTALIALALAFELLPAPRPLWAADIPGVFRIVRDDPDHNARVLELPTGIRDGVSSFGNFSPADQFYQTYHEKPLFGGYLSRVSRTRKRALLDDPVYGALVRLSEDRPLSHMKEIEAYRQRDAFLDRAHLGYVVIDGQRASRALRQFAVRFFDLRLIKIADGYELYRPGKAATLPH